MEGVTESHCVQASNYFAMTLATIHPSLSKYPHLKYLQEKLGLVSLGFLDSYCKMLLSAKQNEALVEVANCIGKDMSEVSYIITIKIYLIHFKYYIYFSSYLQVY